MARPKRIYTCGQCGAQHPQWQGQCGECGSWNSLAESRAEPGRSERAQLAGNIELARLDSIRASATQRVGSGLAEFDRVLGGGVVPGSVVLIGGDPGIGKSTLLLRVLASMASQGEACYVSGEESLDQIALRADRLGVRSAPIRMMAETHVETILAQLAEHPPATLVIDSVQTLYSDSLTSAPGSVSQLRECAAQLVRFAKLRGVATMLVGHVTKEGTLAGPRVLEHMVDTVLYFESDSGSRYRLIRAVKNRFGAANEMGFFVMGADGFQEVKNPSSIFLSRHAEPVAGSVTLATREGSRPVLVEVQALVDRSQGGAPRRVAQGIDAQRLNLLLAVLHRHCRIEISDCDVFANVVGGIKVGETAIDLALSLAMVSSFEERPLDDKLIVFGEVGLTGEIRPVPFGEDRLREAAKHGFERALIPRANKPREDVGIDVTAVSRLAEALAATRR